MLLAIQYGSLTAAGKELGYTQSGMTRMIRSLEKEIGFPLLVRNKQGVRPSANGQQMVPVFQEVVRASQKAADLGAAIQGVLAGVLNIGSYYSVAAAWLPKILRRFQAQYPKVEVHLLEGTNQELAQWLNEKAVDCCLAAKPGADVAYDWIPLKDDELVVWLPPDHPWTAEKEIPVEWLNGAPFIILCRITIRISTASWQSIRSSPMSASRRPTRIRRTAWSKRVWESASTTA